MELRIPRARFQQPDRSTTEFRSTVLRRYQRRTRRLDEAILGAYLAGPNTHRIRKTLEPWLGGATLSKSPISWAVRRIQRSLESWSTRDLAESPCAVLYLAGVHLKVRMPGEWFQCWCWWPWESRS
jgi:transposase-like protein